MIDESKLGREHTRNMAAVSQQNVDKQMNQGMKLFLLQQMSNVQTQIDTAEEKFHSTQDQFYEDVVTRKKEHLNEIKDELKKYNWDFIHDRLLLVFVDDDSQHGYEDVLLA